MNGNKALMRVSISIYNNSSSTLNPVQGPDWFVFEDSGLVSINPYSTGSFVLDATDRTSTFSDDVYYAADTYDTNAPKFDFHFQCTIGYPLGLSVYGTAPSGFTCTLEKNAAIDYLNHEVVFKIDVV